jgi:peptidoglycan/LPS O-acetylase OafA/YrhL
MNNTKHYYPEIDSLRFFAFLSVLIHHSPVPKTIYVWKTLHDFGWIGVDLFLCLSAFLFAKLLSAEYIKQGYINIKYFYIRRILRIWPLYIFFVGLMLVFTFYTNGWEQGIPVRLLGLVTFSDNLFSMTLGYNTAILYVAHLWTISFEEQFYLVIPWGLGFLFQQSKKFAGIILVGLLFLGLGIRALFIYNQVQHPAIWVFPLTHFEPIFGGLIIGLGVFDKVLKNISSWIIFLFGLIALWAVTLLPNVNIQQWKLMLTYPLVGIGVSLILFSIMNGALWQISAIMKSKALGYLGKISYGLYIYHLFAVRMLAHTVVDAFISPDRVVVYPAMMLIISFAFTLVISILSYEILEKPFLKMKSRFTFIKSRAI